MADLIDKDRRLFTTNHTNEMQYDHIAWNSLIRVIRVIRGSSGFLVCSIEDFFTTNHRNEMQNDHIARNSRIRVTRGSS